MLYPAYGYKVVYGLWSFLESHESATKQFHGVLYFSSIEKLQELCPWREETDVIASYIVEDNFFDFDYVPDNY